VGALGRYLERAGIPTAGISLIRLHTEKIKPPRALWVPFELGRPLGAPDDAAFQTRVLKALLALFELPSGPVLMDFPDDAPGTAAGGDPMDMEGMACPIRFDAPQAGEETLEAAVLREVHELLPWYDIARERRGRTTFGVAGLEIEDVARFLCGWLGDAENQFLPATDHAPSALVKLAAEDLKVFYFEAAGGQPQPLTSRALADWFWGSTKAAEMFVGLRERFRKDPDPAFRILGANLMVPREQWSRFGIHDPWWRRA
jgi:hypothetical protein